MLNLQISEPWKKMYLLTPSGSFIMYWPMYFESIFFTLCNIKLYKNVHTIFIQYKQELIVNVIAK